ncbi:CBS domain-containing protein [Actinomadura fulvescens]|uniref:CBS domain-containing protein n=1 Tax=Actinomadura fulvescens TaxID=46160 RepID=A0ABP6CQQ7_9ACTN
MSADTSAMEAARLLADHGLPGLIVVDAERRPTAVLPGSQVLRAIIPRYVQDDPALARVFDEDHADKLCERLAGKRVADLIEPDRRPPPIVDANATAMEIASVMASAHSPVVAVSDDTHRTNAPMIGVITVAQLLTRLLPAQP